MGACQPCFEVPGRHADSLGPVLHGLSNETRAIVGPNERRHAAQDEQIAHFNDDVTRVQLAIRTDSQTLPAVLFDDVECA